MSGRKCVQCGLVNWATAEECQRCGAPLQSRDEDTGAPSEDARHRSLLKRITAIVGMLSIFLFISYVSLHVTSDPITFDQKQVVDRAITVLDEKGFQRQAFILRHLVSYRATDNWWNRWLGHYDAYAATNFPFEVVTLYPDFFNFPVDDVERAAILLHESYHLSGYGEAGAFEGQWRNKKRLGWTKEAYGQNRVWKNTREFALKYVPQLFQCGLDQQSDCTE